MSAGFFSNISSQTSPYIMNQDIISFNNPKENHGISSILSSDFNKLLPTHDSMSPKLSIRRTFSADMSSPKWLQSNGFPLKKVQSSHELQALVEEEDNHGNNNNHDHTKGPAFEDIWSSIQADKRSWGSILSQGPVSGSDSGQLPPPYVHPLAKRSASSLSEKSLEICTESLGSETGSDGFSYSLSDSSEESDKEHQEEENKEKEKEKEYEEQVVELKEIGVNNNALEGVGNRKCSNTSKRSIMVTSSFPPPLPSLANRDDGSNLHIRSHRRDGRLVVEAVSVPSQNCFRARRQDGRLLLTLTSTHEEVQEQNEVDLEVDEVEKEEDIEQGEAKTGIVIKDYDQVEENEEKEVINVPRSPCQTISMVSNKVINKTKWPRNYNTTIIKTIDDEDEQVDEEEAKVTMSNTLLPRQPKMSTATTALNAYEYYWRRSNSPTAAAVAVLNPLAGQQNNNKNNYSVAVQVGKDTEGNNNNHLLLTAHNTKGLALAQQEVVLVKAAGTRGGATSTEGNYGEYLVPFMLRGCKDHKRSFFLLDPYCIAT